MAEPTPQEDPDIRILRLNKEGGYNYRRRRQEQWRETYSLYRDKVKTNRLTQRQSVNVPLMKQTIRTLLKDVDDMPVLYFENLDNDKTAELFKNEYWKVTEEHNKLELFDIVDKRQVFLFGRTFDQMQISNGMVDILNVDPHDMLVPRYTNPLNIDSARFLIHTHIFEPLTKIENNPDYDQDAVKRLKNWRQSDVGLRKISDNLQMLTEKNKKMADMGVDDVDYPILGESYFELAQHFLYREEGSEDEQLYLMVEAENREILMKKPLDEVIGKTDDDYWKTHYPYNTWADDLELQDFWSDGIGDIVRTPNKILNVFFSQLIENRTLRSFGMNYYDSNATADGFNPQTYQPVPWGWYGVPGNPKEIFQKVDIPDLSESLDEMTYITTMLEKATGATATQQGVQTERQITLGEVELALGEAKERVKGMSKFYTPAWQQRGQKFIKLLEAAPQDLDAVKIYKKGRSSSDIYSREISPDDWKTKSGYQCRVWSMDEKEQQDTEALQKMDAVKANMPDNPKVDEIYKRKLTEFAGLKPDEINEVMEYEQQKIDALLQGQQAVDQAGVGGLVPPPQVPPAPVPVAPQQKPQNGIIGQ